MSNSLNLNYYLFGALKYHVCYESMNIIKGNLIFTYVFCDEKNRKVLLLVENFLPGKEAVKRCKDHIKKKMHILLIFILFHIAFCSGPFNF